MRILHAETREQDFGIAGWDVITIGNAYCDDPDTGEVNHTRSMGYPYCPEAAPFASATPEPSAARRRGCATSCRCGR